jgi:competence protein ComEA
MRGFTGPEQRAILFLLSTFGLGTLVWWYRASQSAPEINPAEVAAFEKFLRVATADSMSAPAPAHAQAQIISVAPARVDLNAATYNDLVRLPGIGPVMAQRIIDFRAANGAFKRLQDLRKVKGIGAKTYEKLAPLLVVK